MLQISYEENKSKETLNLTSWESKPHFQKKVSSDF